MAPLIKLVQKADLKGNSWKLRWLTFGKFHASSCIVHNRLTLVSSASLKAAVVDLAATRNHIQQFKEISQASEEALASLNATYDEYKSTVGALSSSWVYFPRPCVYFHDH